MKKYCVLFLILMVSFLSGSNMKNLDKPSRGEWDFKLKKVWAVSDGKDNFLAKIRGIVVSKDEKIFVWDQKQLKVFVYDTNGHFLYDFAKKGEGPGEIMDYAYTRIFLSDKYIILHEVNIGKVNYFSHSGKYKMTRKVLKMKYGNYVNTYINENEFLFFLPENNKRKKSLLGIYNLVNNTYKVIAKMQQDKVFYIKEKHLTSPNRNILASTIFTYNNGKILFGRNDKYLINILDLKTKNSFSFSVLGRKRNELEKKYKEKTFEYLRPYLEKKHIKRLIKNCPDKLTYFNRILIDNRGLIYVFIPHLNVRNFYELDIFSSQGKYLYHSIIKIPDKFYNVKDISFGKNCIYFYAENKDGEIKLVKFSIIQPKG